MLIWSNFIGTCIIGWLPIYSFESVSRAHFLVWVKYVPCPVHNFLKLFLYLRLSLHNFFVFFCEYNHLLLLISCSLVLTLVKDLQYGVVPRFILSHLLGLLPVLRKQIWLRTFRLQSVFEKLCAQSFTHLVVVILDVLRTIFTDLFVKLNKQRLTVVGLLS